MIHYISPFGPGDAWVVNELEIVARADIPFQLHALRFPKSTYHRSEWGHELSKSVSTIYPLRVRDSLHVLLSPFRFRGRFFSALSSAAFGARENARNRFVSFVHFFVACVWAGRLRKDDSPVTHIHSQWIHAAGTVGMFGAWLLDVPFSFTGHAADLYRERVALGDKIRRAAFIGCISSHHERFFLEHGAQKSQLRRIYCGIDVQHFAPRNASARGEILKIRSSGRLVEKKGFEYLIQACRILKDQGVKFQCTIAGSGPLESQLRQLVVRLELNESVELTASPLKQEAIPEFMHGGDVYCLPCVWAADNDVDGLPQMLMEAMACGLPAVSTRLVGIPDLVIDGQTGLLVEPRDPVMLAKAIMKLRDPDLAASLAEAGRQHVIDHFEIETALVPLITEYRRRLGRINDETLKSPLLKIEQGAAL